MTWLMMTKDDPLIFYKYVHLLNSIRISRKSKFNIAEKQIGDAQYGMTIMNIRP